MKTVILLAGYARSGKDTVADYLHDFYGFQREKFAQPLYDMLAAMYGVSPQRIEEWKVSGTMMPHTKQTARWALQSLGTEWGRQLIDERIWLSLCAERISMRGDGWFVISDCRFVNEFEIFADKIAPAHVQLWFIEREAAQPQTHHESERHLLALKGAAHVVLNNNGTLRQLYDQVMERTSKLPI